MELIEKLDGSYYKCPVCKCEIPKEEDEE